MSLRYGLFAQDPPEIPQLEEFVTAMDELGIDVWRDKVYPEDGEPFWTLDVTIGGKVGVDNFAARSSVNEQMVPDERIWPIVADHVREALVDAMRRHYAHSEAVA